MNARRETVGDCILVTRRECEEWWIDQATRDDVQTYAGDRFIAVTTLSGYIVDVWECDHWQSGLPSGQEENR